MKLIKMALIAGALAAGTVAPALAGGSASDAEGDFYRNQIENLYLLTGDPTYAQILRQMDMQQNGYWR
jgi:hypothetical protein